MKEIINSILDSAKERLKNPLLGSFVFSWGIFNWKPIFYILFSKNLIENKIDFVSECYSSMNNNFWFPLLFSTFYILIFPYVLWAFDKLSTKAIIGRKTNLLQLNIADIINKQKIAVEESELENIKASYRDKADLNRKIEILTNHLNEKDEIINLQSVEINQAKNEQNKLKEFIKDSTDSTLNDFRNDDLAEEYLNFRHSDIFEFFREVGSEISRRNAIPSKTDDMVVEKFKHSGIITEARDEENQRTLFRFTTKGDYFWKQYIMNTKLTKKTKEADDLPF